MSVFQPSATVDSKNHETVRSVSFVPIGRLRKILNSMSIPITRSVVLTVTDIMPQLPNNRSDSFPFFVLVDIIPDFHALQRGNCSILHGEVELLKGKIFILCNYMILYELRIQIQIANINPVLRILRYLLQRQKRPNRD